MTSWPTLPMCIMFSVKWPCASGRSTNNNGGLSTCICAYESEFIKASPYNLELLQHYCNQPSVRYHHCRLVCTQCSVVEHLIHRPVSVLAFSCDVITLPTTSQTCILHGSWLSVFVVCSAFLWLLLIVALVHDDFCQLRSLA